MFASIGILATLKEIFRKIFVYTMALQIIMAFAASCLIDENYKTNMFIQLAHEIIRYNSNMNFVESYAYVKSSFLIWGAIVMGLYLFSVFFFTRPRVKQQFV